MIRHAPRRSLRRALLAATLFLAAAAAPACRAVEQPGCLASGGACVPPTACERLAYTCTGGSATAAEITSAAQRPRGLDALAAVGDFILQNDRVTAVIEAPAHQHHLATSGGNLLDLATRDGVDHLNQIYQLTGILPRDTVHYDRAEVINGPSGAAIVMRGGMEGDRRVSVVTRYELRPCDPGLRVRTEIYNGSRVVWSQLFNDAYFWGDRSMTPFAPGRGLGHAHPPLNLLDLDSSLREVPWLAASSHSDENASYAFVACDRPTMWAANDPTISAAGPRRAILRPGEGAAFERMFFVAAGTGLSGATSLALDAHQRLHGGSVAHLRGRAVTAAGDALGGDERLGSLLFYEPGDGADPDDEAQITPWGEAVPSADGSFAVDLPAGRPFRVRVHRHGRPLGAAVAFETPAQHGTTLTLPDVVVAAPARLSVRVTDAMGATPLDAEVILVPTGPTRAADVSGSVHGNFAEGCAPYLGPAHGPSPACNRALAQRGSVDLTVPPGTYWVYATAGMEVTLGRAMVTLREGATETVNLALRRLDGLFPAGSLSADFHVHGGRSFDTGFPDRDRVLSVVIAGIDVITATDHDVCTTYTEAVADLGVGDRLRVQTGAEVTPLVPYLFVPGSTVPQTVGHFITWPLRYDPALPRNGSPTDEFQQPAELFDRMRSMVGPRGVIQLNHPMAGAKVGRDEGWMRVTRFDPRRPLPMRDDGTAPGVLFAHPNGSTADNLGYDAQEAAQGVGLVDNLQHRAVWHAMLSQGIPRAGTADSDSHSMQVEPIGYPRNIVLGNFTLASFDADAFNDAVRNGRMVGTNGPFIEATIMGADGAARGPSLTPFRPSEGATLQITVRAPPWVPVTEVRVVVNGRVVQTVAGAAITQPADPFGTEGMLRWQGSFRVADLMGGRDGWIVVEAGLPIPATADTDDNGFVDHIDANGDGRAEEEDTRTASEGDPRFHANVVSPGHWAFGFTNPMLIDLDGAGWGAPGL